MASPSVVVRNGGIQRKISMETYMVRVYTGSLSQEMEFVSIEAEKMTSAQKIVTSACEKLRIFSSQSYELGEVFCTSGQLCKERRLQPSVHPVQIQLLWPKPKQGMEYRYYLRKKDADMPSSNSWVEFEEKDSIDSFLHMFQPRNNKEYPDLCNLPELNEKTLLENLKSRFSNGSIYTYVGSILIAVNPFKFFPIYNPKYVKNYQNKRLGELPPHIFAIADAAFNSMLREKRNQCIVISGESGSGKTESTNLLLHHLTAISQKGLHGSGVEQTILGAGPVLEAFGNAKTVHNNNSSRFGKFIQVNYKENGMVHGAIVEKYLLEKSRIVFQAPKERNYHVFYYLLAGASEQEKKNLHLTQPQDFSYLNQSDCYTFEGVAGEFVDEAHEFERLKQSMEMVGFSTETQRRLFSVLSAVLHIGNVQFKKKSDHLHHEAVDIKDEETLTIVSNLLRVKEATLKDALTKKKTVAGGDTVYMSYKLEDAISTRDAMAKCLYGALFDWIVLQVNHALISKKDAREHQGCSIGVLDIFGFEDFAKNSFEQFCINYANEHLQYYFNQHIFKFEQEEYVREGIHWKNIEFLDNTSCLKLFSDRPAGLFPLIDEACNLPGATNETLLENFHQQHKSSADYEAPSVRASAFTIAHYAGRVKYQIQDFREKNMDLMRPDIVLVLKNSSLAFVRELVGVDPVAILRWAIVRAFFRCYFAFVDAGKRYRETKGKSGQVTKKSPWLRSQEANVGEDGTLRYLPGHYRVGRDLFHVTLAFSVIRRINRLEGGSRPPGLHEDKSPNDACLSPCKGVEYNKENIRNVINHLNRTKQKSKSFKPRTCVHKGFRDLKSWKTVAGRHHAQFAMNRGSKKSPPSVGTQFQSSLTLLMDTLNLANPFFIRCIKSNADKLPCQFDEEIIQRQLRYTGMLATVEIRRLGYNYRLAFDEFIHHYKILLPNGLLSSKQDVSSFLSANLSSDNYQIGVTKVFLREREKMELDQALHHAIMERVIKIQRWMRFTLERKKFVQMQKASVMIQSHVRSFIVRRRMYRKLFVAMSIQKWYRGFKVRREYLNTVAAVIVIQKHYKGYKARQRFKVLLAQDREQRRLKLEEEKEKERQQPPTIAHLRQDMGDVHSSTSDEGMFTKESSTEELEIDRDFESTHTNDSEESSGILDDSESEVGRHFPPYVTPPLTPVSPKAPPSTPTVKMRPAFTAREAISEESLASPMWKARVKSMVDSIEKPDVMEKPKVEIVYEETPPKAFPRRRSPSARLTSLLPLDLDLVQQEAITKITFTGFEAARPLCATIEKGPMLSPNTPQPPRHFNHMRHRKSTSLVFTGSVSDNLASFLTPPLTPPVSKQTPTSPRLKRQHAFLVSPKMGYNLMRHCSEGCISAPPRRKKFSMKSHSADDNSDKPVAQDEVDFVPNLPVDFRRHSYMLTYPMQSQMRPPLAQQESLADSVFEEPKLAKKPHPKAPFRRRYLVKAHSAESFQDDSHKGLEKRKSAPLRRQRLPLRPKKHSIIKSFSDGSMIVNEYSPSIRVSAPLAKQESISDDFGEDEIDDDERASKSKTLPLNRQQLAHLENVIKKGQTMSPKEALEKTTPTHHGFAKRFKNLVGGKKGRDDDEYQIEEGLSRTHRTLHTDVGIPVLPIRSTGKMSPVKTSDLDTSSHDEKENSQKKVRRPRRGSKKGRDELRLTDTKDKKEPQSNWSVTSRSQWQYPNDLFVRDLTELRDLDQFIYSKIINISEDCGKSDSVHEKVFKLAMKEFHSSLISSQSLAMKANSNCNVRYRELMMSFEQVLKCKAEAEGTSNEEFPSTLMINAFRGFIDEFLKRRDQVEKLDRRMPEKKGGKKKKEKDKSEVLEVLGHKFTIQQFTIPTFCEYCNSLTWWRDKVYNCQLCRFTCHKKCVYKCSTQCRGLFGEEHSDSSGKIFGAPLSSLLHEGILIPDLVDDLIKAIEANGLFTVGLYRKSGAAVKVRQLIKLCNEDPSDIDFNEYQIHVLTSTLKTFLRELPVPLLTYDLFDEFIRAGEISTERERIQSVYSVIEKLPKANHDVLERLMFHLARVARFEHINKMSPNGLAIIFCPCILKTRRELTAQESLSNVPKQTICIECIIVEQLKKLNETLANINELEDVEASFQSRLDSIRDSRKMSKGPQSPESPQESVQQVTSVVVSEERIQVGMHEEEKAIEYEIKTLERKREALTSALAVLEYRHASSDEDMLSADDIEDDEYAMSDYHDAFESPATPADTKHITFPKPGPTRMDSNESIGETYSPGRSPRSRGVSDPEGSSREPKQRTRLRKPSFNTSENQENVTEGRLKLRLPNSRDRSDNVGEQNPKLSSRGKQTSVKCTQDDNSVEKTDNSETVPKMKLHRTGYKAHKFRHSFSQEDMNQMRDSGNDTSSTITRSTDSVQSDEVYYIQMETAEDDPDDEIMV